VLGQVADAYRNEGRFEEAVAAFESLLDARRRIPATDPLPTYGHQHNLAAALTSLGRFEEAYRHQSFALEGWRKALGREHRHTRTALNNSAALALVCGDPATSERLTRELLACQEPELARDPRLAELSILLGASLVAQGRHVEGEELLRPTLARVDGSAQALKPGRVLLGRAARGRALLALGSEVEGEALLHDAFEEAGADFEPANWALRQVHVFWIDALEEAGRVEEAERLRSGFTSIWPSTR
jgi:tetratricopeptide (TPR) repeat protein